MGWWKQSRIENFDDRNNVNARVKKLIALAELLRYAAKLVYQTARGARALATQVAENKTLTSFPDINEILLEADKVAIDSPLKFSDLCKMAAQIIEEKVAELESEREDWTNEKNPNRLKGLVDDNE